MDDAIERTNEVMVIEHNKAVPTVSPAVAIEDEGGAWTLHDSTSGRIFVTNLIGKHVLDLCDGHRAVADVAAKLIEEFSDQTERQAIISDLETFLRLAESKGVIRWKHAL